MKTYTIPVSWTMIGIVEVEAENLNKAIQIAQNDEGVIPIPDNGQYLDDSWKVVLVETV